MINLLVAGVVSFVASLAGTPLLIRWLRARGIGQQIRVDGPQGHFSKAGTPTMGGLTIVVAAIGGYVASHVRGGSIFTRGGLLVLFVLSGAAVVGAVDDWIKVSRQRSLGLNKRAKLGGQLLVAGGFAVLAVRVARVPTELSFTRTTAGVLELGQVGWVVFAVLVVIGTTNAVNLTDGLDGLAAGSSAFVFAAFTIIAYWAFRHPTEYQVPQAQDLAVLATAMAGACTGFLWWNAAPARIFMGDTGSLAIGAGIAGLALVTNVHLLLPVLGGLFVLETLSVMLQVASFRLFHRRVFRMAPIHHHFELAGWPETTVIIRFWILAALFTALALGVFYADYLSVRGVVE